MLKTTMAPPRWFPENAVKSNKWIMIPDWLAGTWRANSEVVMEAYDLVHNQSLLTQPKTISIERTRTIGMQRDQRGRIWHFAGVPYTRVNNAGNIVESQKIESIVFQRITNSEVVVRSTATIVHFRKDTVDVSDMFREETVTTYTPVESGIIRVNFVIKDTRLEDNTPILYSEKMSLEKRIKPFTVVDYDSERGDLKMKFKQFCQRPE
ncbi:MAG: hypothetical protein K2X93_01550 [Candidatus Obscuribacterales bacterium]|nr:hypothetical protein [Candidatus Obscuribacterales bacterium]